VSGTISFAAKADLSSGGTSITRVAIGDLDGDGRPDLAGVTGADNVTSAMRNIVLVPPSITGTTPSFHCGPGTVDLGATASAGTVNWYATITGGSPMGTGTTWTTPSITTTSTYYVDATNTGCTTFSRTAVTATIYSVPTASAGSDATICNGDNTQLNGSGGTSYSWNPTSGLSAANVYNPVASPAVTTAYTLVVTDANTCTASDAVTVYVNPVYSINNSQAICQGNSYSINGHTYTIAGTYHDTLPSIHGCDSIIVTQLTVNTLPTANAGSYVRICKGHNTQLNATGGSSYNWSPATGLTASNIANPVASPDTTTTYMVTVSDLNSCTDSDTLTVIVGNPFANEIICIVTVDTISWQNKIMWEKTDNVGTIGYNVFKEVATNIYSGIGYVPFDSASYYIDLGSNPVAHGDKYKISLMDTCANESEKSPYHKTMNLVISSFGSTMGLSWTAYEDESGLFIPAKYYIYRGSQPDNMQLLDSVTGSFTSYNDANVFDVYYYIVAVQKDPPCNVFGSGKSFSNIKDNITLVGINAGAIYGTINVSPNPFSDRTTLTIGNSNLRITNYELRITDVMGKVVRSYNSNALQNHQIVIERGDLKAGIYFVEMRGEKVYRGKLIVE
jgi:hypothetical protein